MRFGANRFSIFFVWKPFIPTFQHLSRLWACPVLPPSSFEPRAPLARFLGFVFEPLNGALDGWRHWRKNFGFHEVRMPCALFMSQKDFSDDSHAIVVLHVVDCVQRLVDLVGDELPYDELGLRHGPLIVFKLGRLREFRNG